MHGLELQKYPEMGLGHPIPAFPLPPLTLSFNFIHTADQFNFIPLYLLTPHILQVLSLVKLLTHLEDSLHSPRFGIIKSLLVPLQLVNSR